jgi:hypothetical protein
MQYFAPDDRRPERVGKVIGDALALVVVAFVLGMMAVRFLT